MNIIIDNVDFWDNFKAEKYWAPTKGSNLKEIVNNAIFSGLYTLSEKVDGDWRMIIRDLDGTFYMRGRSESVNGGFADKVEWVPHITEALNWIPNGSVLLGEMYLHSKPGSRNVTTILGCLKDKALARQDKGEKLSYYIFDVLAWDGNQMLTMPLSMRIEFMNTLRPQVAKSDRVYLSKYNSDPATMEDTIATILEKGGEGVVLKRLDGKYEQGKRTARKSIKVKKEIAQTIDCFISGVYKPATFEYTGKEIQDWTYWFNTKTNEKINRNMYNDYATGDGVIVPITKGAYHGWAGAIQLAVWREDQVVPVCWISNITEELKRGIVEEPEKWQGKVVEVQAMQIEEDTKHLRHAKIVNWRNDKTSYDCDGHEIWGN